MPTPPPPPPPPPPPGHFLGFAMFLSWRSIPHPQAPDQTHISFLLHIFHVQKPNDTFSQLLIWTFSWVYWEKDNGFKTWTINLKLKMKMKNSLKSASLIEHFMRTLDWISVSLYISSGSHCIRFRIKNYHYLKLSWRNISALRFQKINSLQVRIMHTFISNFKMLPLNTSFNFEKLFLSKHSPTYSCIFP